MRTMVRFNRFTSLSLTILTVSAMMLIGCAGSVVVRTEPPELPVYEQPFCPGPDYLWIPGYWTYGPSGYYWVPGLWEQAPRVGYLWTPGYWGWSDRGYLWHNGYWGRHVGFYGGINYGHGYTGVGYEGGYWKERVFYYNTAVTNVKVTAVNNHVFKKEVVNPAAPHNLISYNGGAGGVVVKPTKQELVAAHESHIGLTSNQKRHHKAAGPKPIPKEKIKNDIKVKKMENRGAKDEEQDAKRK